MAEINRQWHVENRMPKNPTLAQRVEWHRAHAQACACRPVPPSLVDLIAVPLAERAQPGEAAAVVAPQRT